MPFCFEALKSTKISLYEPVSSQKYENGYQTKICDFTVVRLNTWKNKTPAVSSFWLESDIFLLEEKMAYWLDLN